MKEKIEVIEKFLIVITLIGGIIASSYKGIEYLSAKSAVVNAQAAQEQETVNAQQLLTQTYSNLLNKLDEDIRDIDNKLNEEVFKGTVGWDKLILIREEKVKDRNQLLFTLGEQVVQLKANVPSSTANKSKQQGPSAGTR